MTDALFLAGAVYCFGRVTCAVLDRWSDTARARLIQWDTALLWFRLRVNRALSRALSRDLLRTLDAGKAMQTIGVVQCVCKGEDAGCTGIYAVRTRTVPAADGTVQVRATQEEQKHLML